MSLRSLTLMFLCVYGLACDEPVKEGSSRRCSSASIEAMCITARGAGSDGILGEGAVLEVEATVGFGCHSSSTTKVEGHTCTLDVRPDGKVDVGGEVCLLHREADIATADCVEGGALRTRCATAPLSKGRYTFRVGKHRHTVEIPGKLGRDRVCLPPREPPPAPRPTSSTVPPSTTSAHPPQLKLLDQ